MQEPKKTTNTDYAMLHQTDLAVLNNKIGLPQVVSLFSGAGGLDWGFEKSGFNIALAIDISAAAIKTHKRNFKRASCYSADLTLLGPSGVLKKALAHIPHGERIGVIGGPPCQGFSRANTNSKADDPRNSLPMLYIEIIKALKKHYTVEFVVFENVLGMKDKKHADTYQSLLKGLDELGLSVTEKELCALEFGVPQNRRRIVLSAMREGQGYTPVKPKPRKGAITVRQAIEPLGEPVFFDRKLTPSDIPIHPNHWTMRPRSPKFRTPALINKNSRSFIRSNWDEPSRTIAFGHREIHVHPNGKRRLSIYEAMLLQGFPKDFVLEGNLSEQVEQVSNAVPPPLALSIAEAVATALRKTENNA